MNRFSLKIEYDGTLYHGWQKQKDCKTVQGEIELAFCKLVGTNVNVIGAGRTDTGVHAFYQIAHVDLEKDWLPEKLQGALNFFLKKIPISILEVKKVDNNSLLFIFDAAICSAALTISFSSASIAALSETVNKALVF